ncbi:MAG: TonB-dependent receptor plug domain-containing protein, partial [Spongiibacteraceae bacterium]|nr:TonB-dependent receptor plug domain-containing protein [Spongiibacteraceae bacterium]
MRRKLTASAVSFSALFTLSVPVAAQPPAPGASEVVEVTATRLSRELYEMPAAVSVINAQDELRSQQALQLDEALRLVPGLYFQNRYNFAQNLRISARGFGARAPFGVRGLHLQMDGIPFTLPDGQSQVDAIDLNAVERLQVIRGPAAVQYGNGAGGVIDITSASGETLAGFAANLDVGSHDFYKVSARAGGANEHGSAHVSLMRLSYRGYRDQSEVDKRLLHAKFRWDADAARSLTLVAS